MISISDAVKTGAKRLRECGVDNAEYDSFAMLSDITGISRTDYLVRGGDILDADAYDTFMQYIERRCKHEPLQHILGKAWFYGREYFVNSNVLVPRADTEILVEQALKLLKDNDEVLDMCTGSGCIILTLALERKLGKAVGVDLSRDALVVACDNAKKLSADVKFVNSDLFGDVSEYRYDMIVSNPPYIETEVIKTLSEEVRLHDPMMALDGMADGLHFYRNITGQAKRFLKDEGWLIYEIGHNQAEAVSSIMADAGFEDIKVVKDYAGLDRVVLGKAHF